MWFKGCSKRPAASWPTRSGVGKKTSNATSPDASLATASSMLVNVVTSTVTPNSDSNAASTSGEMYSS